MIDREFGNDEEENSEYYDALHIPCPFVENFSGFIQKELAKINVGVVMKKGETVYSRVCRGMKIAKEAEERKNVIYMINCKTCKMPYIGETGQFFKMRRKQHRASVRKKEATNGIFDHLKKNKRHTIDWKSVIFLDHEANWFRRKIKESLFINLYNIGKKTTKLMNIEKGMEIDSCWQALTNDEDFARTVTNLGTGKTKKGMKMQHKVRVHVLQHKKLHIT